MPTPLTAAAAGEDSMLPELIAFLTDRDSERVLEPNPQWAQALWSALGAGRAVEVLGRALSIVGPSPRRVQLLRELYTVDPESVHGLDAAGDRCAQHVVLEERFLEQGDRAALSVLVHQPWPLDARVVVAGLREHDRDFLSTELGRLLTRMEIRARPYRQAALLAKRVAEIPVDVRGAFGFPLVKVALLGDVTTEYLVPVLEAALLEHRVDGRVRAGGYGQIEELVLDGASWLYEFAPDVVVVASSSLTVVREPERDWKELLERRLELCDAITERLAADAVVMSLESLPEHGGPGGAPAWIDAYNAELRRRVPDRAFVFDLHGVVAEQGAGRWFDMRLWRMARQPLRLECVPRLADRLAGFVQALYDPPAKLIVTDLDNTLWGQTVAEVGPEAIEIGASEKGLAFTRLQQFLRECVDEGFLLAACSKNIDEKARAPFATRPEMPLRIDDFVDFQVSFLPKSVVVPQIAERLNLGLQSVVFLDDEAHERAEMRERNPEVLVPEWPEDGVNGLPRLLAASGWLARVKLTADDRRRLQTYRDEGRRRVAQASHADIDAFLESLQLRARFARIVDANLDRVAQLVQKTNQFNLTSFRRTRRELEQMLATSGTYARAVYVEDRYGSYGLTGVIVAVPEAGGLVVDLWLMSCRVMGKTIEYAMFDELHRHAAQAGYGVIRGLYRRTDKNGALADFLPSLGFTAGGVEGDVRSYELRVGIETTKGRKHHVTLIDESTTQDPDR